MRVVLALLLATATLSAVEHVPPKTWNQAAGNPMAREGQPSWRFDQVWPPAFTDVGNFVAMTWKDGKRPAWGVTEHGFGGQPTAAIKGGAVEFNVRGPRSDAKPCIASLAFVPTSPGAYTVRGTVDVNRWEGRNEVGFAIYKRNVTKATIAAVKEFALEPEAGNAIAAETTLEAGDELLLVARVIGFNTAATITVRDLVITGP